MAYTKKNVEENKRMKARADELVVQVGYDPSVSYEDYVSHRRGCMNEMTVTMEQEFPMIGRDRIRHQVSAAMIRVYSRWVQVRDREVRNGE